MSNRCRGLQAAKLLQKGLQHHRAGRWGPAEACYRRTLRGSPRSAQALCLLSLLAQQAGQQGKSLRWMEAALSLPAGEDDPGALHRLANAFLNQGQFEPARRCYQRLVELEPQSSRAHLHLGTALEGIGEWEAAARSYQCALSLEPGSPDIYASLGRLQSKQGAWAEAAHSCRQALALDARRHEIYNLLGYALINTGDLSAAVDAYRRALQLKPGSAYAIYGLGYLFERQGDLAAAAESYRLALKFDPRLADAYLHLGITHFLQGGFAQAVECFERVRELSPGSAEAQTFLGHIHLLEGRFVPGWSEHEFRWQTPHFQRGRRCFPQPQWRGEPLEGSRILLHAEQGLGDALQFVRYVPLVAARGGEVILEIPPPLYRLLAAMEGARKVVRRSAALPEADWHCPLLSLPLALGTDLHSIPAHIPYVFPDPALVEAWAKRLAKDTLRVGLVWAGSPAFAHERWRGIPLELLAPLTHLPGATFYSLQMGTAANQVKQLGDRLRIVDLQDEHPDFADTAAIVANLGLVISVDTSVAHLAGAMGKPVWILLHKSPDWRWLLDRDDSPWYPTARLFRQSALGEWGGVVARVEEALHSVIASGSAGPGRCAP